MAGIVRSVMCWPLLNGMTRMPSATSAAISFIFGPSAPTRIGAMPWGLGPGSNAGVESVWRVYSPFEPQRRALLPVLQDRLDRQHPLAHVRDRPPELAPEALLHVRLDLRAEPEAEPPAGQLLEVVGRVGQVPRAARERDGDVGHEVEVAHRRGGDQREEEVVRVLEAEDAVDAERLQLGRPARRLHHRLRELDVDLHGHARDRSGTDPRSAASVGTLRRRHDGRGRIAMQPDDHYVDHHRRQPRRWQPRAVPRVPRPRSTATTSTPGATSTRTRSRTSRTPTSASATGTATCATSSSTTTASSARSSSPTPCRRSSRASCSSPSRRRPRTTSTATPGVQAHNRWLADYCSPEARGAAPASARSSSTTSTTPSPTCSGARRTACAAACSSAIPPITADWLKPLYDPYYDPLWAGVRGARRAW